MSTRNQRKRAKRLLSSNDFSAMNEGKAIDRRLEIGVVHTPRLKHTYQVDGQVFCTGSKHRYGGGDRWQGDSNKRPIAKPTQHRNSKQTDLRSINAHKRIDNPIMYRHAKERKAQHLMEYQAGLVRNDGNL